MYVAIVPGADVPFFYPLSNRSDSMFFSLKKPKCNICQKQEFADFNNRTLAQCCECKSLERHRVFYEVCKKAGLFAKSVDQKNVIHFAPEPFLAPSFQRNRSLNYLVSDPHPTRYKWTRRLCLMLPDDLRVFQDGYFDFILHNHMLEHLPGHWCDHLEEFKRLLAPSGKMIFSLPGPKMTQLTEEGGEHFSSDDERLAKFGQHDHFRQFGSDLISYMENSEGMSFAFDDLSDVERKWLSVGAGKDRLLIWTRL